MNDKNTRKLAYNHGILAEILVAWLYRLRGYRLISKRQRTPFGEIDLIMRRSNFLVFIEVKARKKNTNHASAFSERQQKRVFQAAEYYFHKNFYGQNLKTRIDYACVGPSLLRIKILFGADRSIEFRK
jgi:putative endonuclease